MAKIYTPPGEIKVPEFSFKEIAKYREECDKFTEELKQWCLKRKSEDGVGEIIGFPVADGKALYMIASVKPVQLIHLPLWDAWEFQYAKNLTTKDVKTEIGKVRAWNVIISKRQNEQNGHSGS